jgi:hypothetical protein
MTLYFSEKNQKLYFLEEEDQKLDEKKPPHYPGGPPETIAMNKDEACKKIQELLSDPKAMKNAIRLADKISDQDFGFAQSLIQKQASAGKNLGIEVDIYSGREILKKAFKMLLHKCGIFGEEEKRKIRSFEVMFYHADALP